MPNTDPHSENEHETHGSGPSTEHPDVRYEPRDVVFRNVLIVVISGFCIGAVIAVLIYSFFRGEAHRLADRRASEFPLAEHPARELPPAPRMEQLDRVSGVATQDVFLTLSQKEAALNTYGPTKDQAFVHVPILRAMDAVAGHLPVRKQAPQGRSRDQGLLDYGESNSGRLFREAGR